MMEIHMMKMFKICQTALKDRSNTISLIHAVGRGSAVQSGCRPRNNCKLYYYHCLSIELLRLSITPVDFHFCVNGYCSAMSTVQVGIWYCALLKWTGQKLKIHG